MMDAKFALILGGGLLWLALRTKTIQGKSSSNKDEKKKTKPSNKEDAQAARIIQHIEDQKVPSMASGAVLVPSNEMPEDAEKVQGYDFNDGVDYDKLLDSYLKVGYQSTNMGLAILEIEKMLKWRSENGEHCKIFLSFTSNLISAGYVIIYSFELEA